MNRLRDSQKLAARGLESATSRTVLEHRGALVSDAACHTALQPREGTSPTGQQGEKGENPEWAMWGVFHYHMAFVRLEPVMLERIILHPASLSNVPPSFLVDEKFLL